MRLLSHGILVPSRPLRQTFVQGDVTLRLGGTVWHFPTICNPSGFTASRGRTYVATSRAATDVPSEEKKKKPTSIGNRNICSTLNPLWAGIIRRLDDV